MYIQLPESTTRLYRDDLMDEPLEPEEPGAEVRVPADVGETLAAEYPGVEIVEDEREGQDAEDAQPDPDGGDDTDGDETASQDAQDANDAPADDDGDDTAPGYEVEREPDNPEGDEGPETRAVDADLGDET